MSSWTTCKSCYIITTCNRILENHTVTRLVKKLAAFYITRNFIIMFTLSSRIHRRLPEIGYAMKKQEMDCKARVLFATGLDIKINKRFLERFCGKIVPDRIFA
jgi:hypothetical protein